MVDLESIPHFSVFSDSPNFDGQSWTVQVEILQHENLAAGPLKEEAVPPMPGDNGPPLFGFFGLSQQVLAPVPAHDDQPVPQEGQIAENNAQENQEA